MAFSPETYAILKGKIKQLEEEIAALTGPTDWLGVTSTPLTEGSTINPIVVNGQTVTATDGSIASYNGIEFVFTGSVWQEFGRDSSGFVTKAGLRQTTGNATDNAMSQKAVSDALADKISRTDDLANTVENSDKAIKGSGIYSALQQKQDTLTIDAEPIEDSTNPVSSGGVKEAINESYQDLLERIDDLNDAVGALTNAVEYLGVTTTQITDGTTNPNIVIGGETVEAESGDKVIYNNITYIYNGDIWQEVNFNADDYILKENIEQQTGQGTDKVMSQKTVTDALSSKQNTLTFDNAPTQNSDNPVKSRGIYSALQQKQDVLTIDSMPISGSNNPIKSNAVYQALQQKQDALTFDNLPISGSNNPVKSSGVYSAMEQRYYDLLVRINELTSDLDALAFANQWIGVTTTPITEGSDISTVVINNHNVTVEKGDVVTYDNTTYIYNGDIWQEFAVNEEDYILRDRLLQQPGQITDNTMSQKAITDALNAKQNALTFDNEPTQNSDNPVKSRGIYSALQQKQNTLTFDNTPTQNSDNPVKSNGIYQAIQDAISSEVIDDEVTEESSNPVKSSGIYDAIYGLKLSITNGYLTLNEELQFSMELTEDSLSMVGSAEISDDTIIIDGPVAITNNSMVYPA